MAEQHDEESKTEEATEKKIRDEVERGNVPFSRETANFASVSGMLIIAAFLLKDFASGTTHALERLLSQCASVPLRNSVAAIALANIVALEFLWLLTPTLTVLMASGLLASFAQNTPHFILDRIQPDSQRISVANGWHRIFGKRGQTEFLKGVFKLSSMCAILWFVLQSQLGSLTGATAVDPEAVPELILKLAMRLMSVVCVATLILFAVDLVWARLHWRKDMRMTKQEIKDELKQNESDPILKSRLRSLALDRMRKSMIASVPRATLVIANPTHYAIALRYVKEEGGAPLVLSKGQDLIALKIREIAEQHSIPIIEDKLLAKSMYESAEVDRTIPPEFYKAVAELIHFLHHKSVGKTLIQ